MIASLDAPSASEGASTVVGTDQETRLRGFAMLVALGDQHTASVAWRRALDARARHRPRQPMPLAEGWLRRRVLREIDEGLHDRVERLISFADDELEVGRRATLRALGASDAVIHGLKSLSPRERGVVVAYAVERLDPREIGEMLGRGEPATHRIITRAMRRYVRGAEAMLAQEPWARRQAGGEIAARVEAAAGRAVSGREEPA